MPIVVEGGLAPRIECPVGMKMVTVETIRYNITSMELSMSETDFSTLIRILTEQL